MCWLLLVIEYYNILLGCKVFHIWDFSWLNNICPYPMRITRWDTCLSTNFIHISYRPHVHILKVISYNIFVYLHLIVTHLILTTTNRIPVYYDLKFHAMSLNFSVFSNAIGCVQCGCLTSSIELIWYVHFSGGSSLDTHICIIYF